MTNDEDELIFADEDTTDIPMQFWKVLVVDDDEDVHQSTMHALAGMDFLGRELQFFNAYSAKECITTLNVNQDIAVILQDVVMETQDTGLQIVNTIRRELKLFLPRIILRTGQPGYAPELDTIRDYDINDYKAKNELTRNKLYISVLSAIRSYDQLMRLDASRYGLEQIVDGCGQLIAETGLQAFAAGVIRQLAAVLDTDYEGLLCAQAISEGSYETNDCLVIAAAGRYQGLVQRHLNEIDDAQIIASVQRCLQTGTHLFEDNHLVLYFSVKSGKHFAVYVKSSTPPSTDNRELLKVFCSNVSVCAENINLVNRLKEVAYYDKLVNLNNRIGFIHEINACFSSNDYEKYSVVLIDIDQFAEINNAFGHNYGDCLLIELSNRLKEYFGQTCKISRVAGDVFAMLGLQEEIHPRLIRSVLNHPFYIDGMEHTVAMSTGTVALKDSIHEGQAVLKDAGIARKMARASGVNSDAHYSNDIGIKTKARTELLRQLQLAYDQKQIVAFYQPQVDMRTKKLIGFESLMRWRNDQGNWIPPIEFIPLAEQSGLIIGLGSQILRESLAFMQQLQLDGWQDLQISVNVSMVQFRMPDFIKTLQQAIEDIAIDPHCLELEITESVAMMEQSLVISTLQQIRAMGIKIAIDDFGTGFSSLSYLENLPLDRLKVDRSFVETISSGNRGQRIVELVIQLGQSLGLNVIAEGVEVQEQINQLLELGCHEAQGYFYAKPMSAADLGTWMQENYATH